MYTFKTTINPLKLIPILITIILSMLLPMTDQIDKRIEMKVRELDPVMELLHNHRLTIKETKIWEHLLFRYIVIIISKIK